MDSYTIGQLAKQVGVSTDTIRMYEKIGLIEKPSRGINQYRQYSRSAILRVTFIKRAKEMGFTLKEIGELLALKTSSSHTCDDVRKQAEIKLHVIEEKLTELKRLKLALKGLIHSCHDNQDDEECPILILLEKKTNA